MRCAASPPCCSCCKPPHVAANHTTCHTGTNPGAAHPESAARHTPPRCQQRPAPAAAPRHHGSATECPAQAHRSTAIQHMTAASSEPSGSSSQGGKSKNRSGKFVRPRHGRCEAPAAPPFCLFSWQQPGGQIKRRCCWGFTLAVPLDACVQTRQQQATKQGTALKGSRVRATYRAQK